MLVDLYVDVGRSTSNDLSASSSNDRAPTPESLPPLRPMSSTDFLSNLNPPKMCFTGNAISDSIISLMNSNVLPPPPRLPRPIRHTVRGQLVFHMNSRKGIERIEFVGCPTEAVEL